MSDSRITIETKNSKRSPAISIVVPVFNRVDELRRALVSIHNQDFGDFEVIVVDDASKIDVKSVVEEFDSRFVYSRLDKNSGPSVARSHAFKFVRGNIIGFLDSDNEYCQGTLGRAHDLLSVNNELGGVAGNYLFSGKVRRASKKQYGVISSTDYRRGLYAPFDQVGFVRREVLELWLTRDQEYFHSEFHLWLSYGLNYSHLIVDEVWGKYHENAQVRNSLVFDERKFTDIGRFIDEYEPILQNEFCVPLDHYLIEKYWLIRKRDLPIRAALLSWMRKRKIGIFQILKRKVFLKINRILDKGPFRGGNN